MVTGTNIACKLGMRTKNFLFITYSLLILSLITYKQEKVPEPYRPTHAHDAYRYSLDQAGLAQRP